MSEPRAPVLRRLQALARHTDQCVTTAAMLSAGISPDEIRSLVRRQALTRITHSVYLARDHVLSDRQVLRAGLMAAGTDGVVAGRSAAEHYGLLPPAPGPTDIAVHHRRNRRSFRTGPTAERTGRPAEIALRPYRPIARSAVHQGLATASVADVLLDLSSRHGGDVLHKAWREADFLRLLRPDDIARACASRHPGHGVLARLAAAQPLVQTDEVRAQTKAEFVLIEQLLILGVARPKSGAPLLLDGDWYFPDLWWVDLRAVVEVDGPIHANPRRHAADLARDAHMSAHGIAVKRVERDAVLADPRSEARVVAEWLSRRWS